MDCLRCRGMMVVERFEEAKGDLREISFYGWRCVCCGNIFDPVIAANRLRPLLPHGNDMRQRLPVAEVVKTWGLDIEAA